MRSCKPAPLDFSTPQAGSPLRCCSVLGLGYLRGSAKGKKLDEYIVRPELVAPCGGQCPNFPNFAMVTKKND